MGHQTVAILDFGSQYAQLIAQGSDHLSVPQYSLVEEFCLMDKPVSIE